MTALLERLAQAIARHQAGDFATAEALYGEVVAEDETLADPWHLWGVVAHQRGDHAVAIARIRQALALSPGNSVFLCNLGCVEYSRKQYDAAFQCFDESLASDQQNHKAWYNYGNALLEVKQTQRALACYLHSILIRRDYAQAHTNIGVALRDLGRHEEAVAFYREAARLEPHNPRAHFNLGNALKTLGGLAKIGACQTRLDPQTWCDPDFTPPEILAQQTELEWNADELHRQAERCYERVISLCSEDTDARTNLGGLYKTLHRYDDAIAVYREVPPRKPGFAPGYSNLAIIHQILGERAEAWKLLEQALEVDPSLDEIRSNLCCLTLYSPEADASKIFHEHALYGQTFADPLPRFVDYPQTRDPHRTLRVGYVSPDLVSHPVGRFIEAAFQHCDRSQIETYVYADHEVADAQTRRLKPFVSQFRYMHKLDDIAYAQQIRDDAIDILVDLSGHTAGHRLKLFARRPAPVQVTYLGYPGTTGLKQIDYVLVDSIVAPPGCESEYTETVLRLDPCFTCYSPPPEAPDVAPAPVLSTNAITFGALHNLTKLNAGVFDAWAEVLRQTPGSRLLLCRDALVTRVQERYRAEFAQRGISPERLDLRQALPKSSHLAVYHEIDIALDAWPWSGHTTTCEAVWMGVPCVTLLGDRHAGRMVASVLAAAGHPEWIARTPDEFVDIATRLARDPATLAAQRARLREETRRSPLCNGPAFANRLTAIYREIWQRYCASTVGQFVGLREL